MDRPGKNFRFKAIVVGEYEVYYGEAGPIDAPVVIVSLPGSAGIEMSTAKDELARTCRVIEVNPPGWAGRGSFSNDMTQEEIGGILAQAIMRIVEGPFYLIGTSMGGTNALYVAAALPDRVRGIVLEGSMAPSSVDDLVMPPPTVEQRKAMSQAFEAGDDVPYPKAPPHPRKPWADEAFVAEQMKNRFIMMGYVDPDFTAGSAIEVVRDRKIPVLALLGSADGILKPSQREAVATVLPHAKFVVVQDGHHDLQNTTPEVFVEQVQALIAGDA